MTGKEQAILTLKALIETDDNDLINKDYLKEKLDAIMTMVKPMVLLNEEGKKQFRKFAIEEAMKGKIIYNSYNYEKENNSGS
jgi:hypothetical protein